MNSGFVLEVRVGVGEPASIGLVPGTPLDPTSFGRTAMWRIQADGVLDVHGYVYFDGHSLFVQSANVEQPVIVNRRHRIGTAWTEVRAPTSLTVGAAEIELRVTDLDRSGALIAMPEFAQPIVGTGSNPVMLPEPPRGPWDASQIAHIDTLTGNAGPPRPNTGPMAAAPFARGAFVARDDESTRFAPIGEAGSTPELPPLGASRPPPMASNPPPVSRQPPMPSTGPMSRVPPPPRSSAPRSEPRAQPLQSAPRGSGLSPLPGPSPVPFPPTAPVPIAPSMMRSNAMPVTSPSVRVPIPLAAAPAPLVGRAPTLWERVKEDWYATSLPKRVLFVLSPFVVLSYFKLFFWNEPPPVEEEEPSGVVTESASAVQAPPTVPSTPPTIVQPPQPQLPPQQVLPQQPLPPQQLPQQPLPQPQLVPQPPQLPVPQLPQGQLPQQVAPPVQPQQPQLQPQVSPQQVPQPQLPQQPPPPQQPPVATPLTPLQRTLERAAADELAAGNYPTALQLYDRLARERPENPAYAEAARIIRERMDAGR